MIDGALVESSGYGIRVALDDDCFVEPLARLVEEIYKTCKQLLILEQSAINQG